MDITTYNDVKTDLARDEGRKDVLYKDSLGFLTGGIGHLMSKKLSPAVIDLWFQEDLSEALKLLDTNLPWWINLSPVRQRVLLNMAFNLGPKLLGFTNTLQAMKIGNYTAASQGMLDSKWATQVGKRAKRLAYMMNNDSVPPNTSDFF